jgi:glycosyltransferase involved in cell wall biosynthesis
VSDVELPARYLREQPYTYGRNQQQFEFIMIGSLEQLYKAPHIAIAALALCVERGFDVCLKIIGDGKHRTELEGQAATLGIGEQVQFLGKLPAGDPIFAALDRADIFLMPSFQEGLPRAMVEAMARAMPCIGSKVGGIPELLDPEDLIPPGDAVTLANKMQDIITHPERMTRMSARNLATAQGYVESVLRQQRNDFYQYVKDHTAAWQKRRGIVED